MLDIYVISLERQNDRKASFLELNSALDANYNFVAGIDGKSLDASELITKNLIQSGTKYYTQSHLGCGLSHRTLWLKAIELQKPIIVCEDDVALRSDFVLRFANCTDMLPLNWQFLLLGYNFDSILEFDIIPQIERLNGYFYDFPLDRPRLEAFRKMRCPTAALPLRYAFGLPAYALSPVGAQHFLSNCFPLHNRPVQVPGFRKPIIAFSIDSIMNTLYSKMLAYVCVPPLAVAINQKDRSDELVEIPG